MNIVTVEERLNPEDAFALDPATMDSNYHYRFCSPRNLTRRRMQGYQLVSRKEDKVRFLNEDGRLSTEKPDDLLWKGDAVLMKCLKSTYNQRRKKVNQLAQDRLNQEGKFTEKVSRHRRRGLTPLNESEPETEEIS